MSPLPRLILVAFAMLPLSCSTTPKENDFVSHYRRAAELAKPEYDLLLNRHASGELDAPQYRNEVALLNSEVERRANDSLLRHHTLENQVDTRNETTPKIFRDRQRLQGSIGQNQDL
ncbi:hypothetical protein OAF27_02755 [Verrucomicrobiales bacterium]|nr:hypothetical protein [Verrucomicrobiales bacterium]